MQQPIQKYGRGDDSGTRTAESTTIAPDPYYGFPFQCYSRAYSRFPDLYRRDDQIEALILDYQPTTPATMTSGGEQYVLPPAALTVTKVDVK
ncbi:MAG: hypothetical protein M3R24_20430 [Chloroflexota bacterium]|nr:hypothetical protein [Chloroflexota bacterium]